MATRSDEADVVPPDDPDGTKATIIGAVLGEMSPFHDANGYYAQGVGEDTAWLPDGWRDRLIPFEAPSILVPGRGLAIERHDLAASKLAAGRIKDFEFVEALIAVGILDVPTIRERLDAIPPGAGSPGQDRRRPEVADRPLTEPPAPPAGPTNACGTLRAVSVGEHPPGGQVRVFYRVCRTRPRPAARPYLCRSSPPSTRDCTRNRPTVRTPPAGICQPVRSRTGRMRMHTPAGGARQIREGTSRRPPASRP